MAASSLGLDFSPIQAHAASLRKDLKSARETSTICCYCAVGCGALVQSVNGRIINIEGDPDHPISEGALCSKGAALIQLAADNPARLQRPMYRAPYSTRWQEVSWDWALEEIARRIKTSRDASLVTKNTLGQTVNRTEGIASVGSAALDNEECYLYQKFLRALGLVYIEHQARI